MLGDADDINLVDLGYYLLGDWMAMTARSSEQYKIRNDQTAFRFIEQVDGARGVHTAITPANNGSTLSPVVKLN